MSQNIYKNLNIKDDFKAKMYIITSVHKENYLM